MEVQGFFMEFVHTTYPYCELQTLQKIKGMSQENHNHFIPFGAFHQIVHCASGRAVETPPLQNCLVFKHTMS